LRLRRLRREKRQGGNCHACGRDGPGEGFHLVLLMIVLVRRHQPVVASIIPLPQPGKAKGAAE
jgi:hypothetical protein